MNEKINATSNTKENRSHSSKNHIEQNMREQNSKSESSSTTPILSRRKKRRIAGW